DHHFMWTRGADGIDVLQQRPDFAVLPRAGEVIDQGGKEVRFRIENAQEDIVKMMADVLQRDFQARPVTPDPMAWRKMKPPCSTYLLDGKQVQIMKYDEASVYATEDGQAELIRHIGDKINQELATGKYDSLFTN